MREINLSEWFERKPRKTILGIELELTLFDLQSKRLVDSNDKVINILEESLPRQIWKDYYPYQLEIRSRPFDNPNDAIEEVKRLYKEARSTFIRHGIAVIPATSILRDGQVFCGLHIHISYPKATEQEYWKRAMGIYPFALSIADHTKNFEIDLIHASKRLIESRHIGKPFLEFHNFIRGTNKYADIAYRRPQESDTRERLKRPATVEIRLFDTPSLFSHFKFIVEAIYHIASHIRDDNPFVRLIEVDRRKAYDAVNLTRLLVEHQRYGVNKILNARLNTDICEMIAEHFGINFPRETQFEYRERLGLSSNINGFLTLALKGGWD